MSDAERRLWSNLRLRQLDGVKFRKQAPIGRYIVDFVCFERNLVIELDGGQHAERIEEDAVRTAWLNSRGYRVIRFWNYVIFEDLEAVLESIGLALLTTPHPNPPPQGGRESDLG
jgi:very-short-patch-repair endonuclease